MIDVINNNIKKEFIYIAKYIEEKLNVKDLKNSESIKNLNDALTPTFKKIRRLKLLKNEFKIIQSKIDELEKYAHSPQMIDTDDEEKWEKEENQIKNENPFELEI